MLIRNLVQKKFFWIFSLLGVLLLGGLTGKANLEAARGDGWSGWTKLPGETLFRPALTQNGNQVIAALTGMDSGIYTCFLDEFGALSKWRRISRKVGSAPVVVEYRGRFYAFAQSEQGKLVYATSYTPDRWSDLRSLGIDTLSAPSAVVFRDRIYVVIRGNNNEVYLNSFYRGGWSRWQSLGGATKSEPFIGVYQNNLAVAVRGMNDGIYLNQATSKLIWGGWQEVPYEGRTLDGPSFVEIGNRFYMAVRGTDNAIWVINQENRFWRRWVSLGGATVSAPAITAVAQEPYIMVRGTDNGIYVNTLGGLTAEPEKPEVPEEPMSWGDWNQYLDGETPSGPATAVYQNQLFTMVRGTDNEIYVKAGLGKGWASIGGATPSSPALAGFNGNLYALVRGTDNKVYLNRYDVAWRGWVNLGGATLSGGALAAYNGRLYAVVRGTDNKLWINSADAQGRWSGWSNLGGLTNSEPGLGVAGGKLYLAVRGTDDKIYLREYNGMRWTNWAEVPGGGKTPSGPAVAQYNKNLWLICRGTDNKLYYNENQADRWSGWREIDGGGLTNATPAAVEFHGELQVVVKGVNNNFIYINSGNALDSDEFRRPLPDSGRERRETR